MRGKAVDRRWLWPFVGVAVFVVACALLAWWQWDRAQSASGTARNLAYALEWPSFAGFAIYMLYRAIKLERDGSGEPSDADTAAKPEPDSGTAVADRTVSREPGAPAAAEVTAGSAVPAEAPAVVVPRQESTVWTARRPSDVVDPEPDPELDQYNRYLAMLHAADEERG